MSVDSETFQIFYQELNEDEDLIFIPIKINKSVSEIASEMGSKYGLRKELWMNVWMNSNINVKKDFSSNNPRIN